jgi:hypothetical protein
MPRTKNETTRTIQLVRMKRMKLSQLATALFRPMEKNSYIFNKGSTSIAITDLNDLRDNLDSFTVQEALCLASWLDYLGDHETADNIREEPVQFKEIIADRYDELKEFRR